MARVRLPLQLGRAAINQGTRFAAFVWLGPALLVLAAMFPGNFLAISVFGLAGVIAIAFAIEAAGNAKRDRPADILLDEEGFTIEGGPLNKAHYRWRDVDAARCKITDGETRTALRWLVLDWLTGRKVNAIHQRVRVRVHQLELERLRASDDDRKLMLAEAEHDEVASLEQLRDAIRAVALPNADAAAPELPQDVLRCPQCSAPQVPAATPTMSCPFCHHELAVPEELQQRMKAVTDLEQASSSRPRLVKALVDQPSARRAGFTVAWCRRLMVWVQPGAIALLVALVVHQTDGIQKLPYGVSVSRGAPSDDGVFFYDIGLLVLMIAVVFAIGWSVGHAYVANRQALRTLVDNFGAVGPAKPGEPSTCRQCAAPLPASAALLVRCVYCSTENVLGIDPRPAAKRRKREQVDLSRALRKRRRAQIATALVIPASILLSIAMVREVRIAWRVPQRSVKGFEPTCIMGPCGTVSNHDLVRRRLTFTRINDGTRGEITILPRGRAMWACTAPCSIEVGGVRVTPDDDTRVDTEIEHGDLRQVTPSPAN